MRKTTMSLMLTAVLVMLAGVLCANAVVYEVGPGRTYENINSVPWESLVAGDTVRIHYRKQPYKEKIIVAGLGAPGAPITVQGVPNEAGLLPVLDGNNATTRSEVQFWGDVRSVVKVGGATKPHIDEPRYIVIENLEIKSCRPPYKFTDSFGKIRGYKKSASPMYIESGEHITIRNCIIRDGGNGILSSHASEEVLIEGCYIYDNGIAGKGGSGMHDTYTESHGITYQYNRFGNLRSGCGGNGLKDRSSGTIVRYNWLSGGLLKMSLVESDYSDIRNEPRYRNTYVYGNVFYDDGAGARYMSRYGGDQGSVGNMDTYRKGTMFFYNNSIIYSKARSGITYAIRLESRDERCDFRNNVIYSANPGAMKFAMLEDYGTMELFHNWSNMKWQDTWWPQDVSVKFVEGNVVGDDPRFMNFAKKDFRPTAESPFLNRGQKSRANPEQYVKHQSSEPRPDDGATDLGAFEFAGEAAKIDYMSLSELAVVDELNLARTDPAGYAVFVEEYRGTHEGEGVFGNIQSTEGLAAVDEAINYLKSAPAIAKLFPSEGLSEAAEDHATDTGPRGLIGHDGSDGSTPASRISRHGTWGETVGENIAYGVNDPREIVIALIVDDGVADRGHRKNIFNAAFKRVGVALGKHSKYGLICVQNFAGTMDD